MYSIQSDNPSGKVFVQGQAVRNYPCDQVEFTIEFRSKNTSAAKASSQVTEQCELFLQRMHESGVDISEIVLKNDKISANSYSEDDLVKASRELQFVSKADVVANNLILRFIQEEHLDANLSTDYSISNEDEIRRMLRAEAVADSKANAELLAAADGRRIAGIDSINIDSRERHRNLAKSITIGGQLELPTLSQELSVPIKELKETVDVVWLLGEG